MSETLTVKVKNPTEEGSLIKAGQAILRLNSQLGSGAATDMELIEGEDGQVSIQIEVAQGISAQVLARLAESGLFL